MDSNCTGAGEIEAFGGRTFYCEGSPNIRVVCDKRTLRIDRRFNGNSLAKEPSAELLRDLAVAFYLNGHVDKATEHAERAVEMLQEKTDEESESLRQILKDDLDRYLG